MRVALAVWNGRISPVFDVARHILLLDVENGRVAARSELSLDTEDPVRKAGLLAEHKTQTLLCGAVSRSMACVLDAQGIRTVSFLAGDSEDIIKAFLAGNLADPALVMPGCCGRQGRFRGWRNRSFVKADPVNWERKKIMPQGDGTGPEGKGPGTGRGRGRCRRQGGGDPGRPGRGGGRPGGGGGGGGRGLGRGGGGFAR